MKVASELDAAVSNTSVCLEHAFEGEKLGKQRWVM